MTDLTEQRSPLARLYKPGERFGWTFRDRNLFRTRYPAPYPSPAPVSAVLVNSVAAARKKMVGRMLIIGGLTAGLALILACCGGFTSGESGGSPSTALFSLAGLTVVAGLAGVGIVWTRVGSARTALAHAQADQLAAYRTAVSTWERARVEHDAAEQARVDALDEWGAAKAPPGPRRVDIIGGSLWGWEALLTIFGGSLLCTRDALTLVDFTGESLGRELVRLAADNHVSYDVRMLPSQLDQTNLLDGLRPRQVADALIESMHGESTGGTRADRAQDDRILTAVCGALGDNLTLGRIAASVRVLMGEGTEHSTLTDDERRAIAGLFGDEFRRGVHPNLRRIEAFIHPLADMGSAPSAPGLVRLQCLVDESEGRSARRELLKDLIVQWLIQRVSADDMPARSIVIAGADEVSHLHLERLTDLCERRDIRLVLLFRHLRDAAVTALGGGVVGFMRLGNHEEARQAAEFIGRQHTFVLSRLTRTVGGDETHSSADTDSTSSQKGGGWSASGRHTNRSTSRSWAHTVSVANGMNWSDAASSERVYQYAVEPRTLQNLPDYALLLVEGQGANATLTPVECNPEIVLLPRTTMAPLPAMELPVPEQAWIPTQPVPGGFTADFGHRPAG